MTMSTLLLDKGLNSFANDLKRLLDKGVDIVTIVNESLDVFKEAVADTDTRCRVWDLVIHAGVSMNMMLTLYEKIGDEAIRNKLIEGATQIIVTLINVLNSLKRNRYSCEAIDEGLKKIDEIVVSIDRVIEGYEERQ
jgi:hypothetical protein